LSVQDYLTLTYDDMARLVEHVEVRVEAHRVHHASELTFTQDWIVLVEELRLHHADVGLDAAIIGLAQRAGERVRRLLDEPGEERQRLSLLVRLHLAERVGSLDSLLQRSTRGIGWEDDDVDNLRPA
jgi:hypothetical protein